MTFQINSEYMKGVVEREELKIRQNIAGALWRSLQADGVRKVTVSYDSSNESEREIKSKNGSPAPFIRAVTKADENDYYFGTMWVFGWDKDLTKDSPKYWFRISPENLTDIVVDYGTNAEHIMKSVNEMAAKYE